MNFLSLNAFYGNKVIGHFTQWKDFVTIYLAMDIIRIIGTIKDYYVSRKQNIYIQNIILLAGLKISNCLTFMYFLLWEAVKLFRGLVVVKLLWLTVLIFLLLPINTPI
jgi:hypothetical protein